MTVATCPTSPSIVNLIATVFASFLDQTTSSATRPRALTDGPLFLASLRFAFLQVLEHDKAPTKVQKEKPKTKNINLVQFFPTAE